MSTQRLDPSSACRLLVITAGLMLASIIAAAQVDDPLSPAIEDGFAADKLYHLGDVDSVDLSSTTAAAASTTTFLSGTTRCPTPGG